MRVLVACEFSGIVRDAFIRRGHDAWSCDLLPTEKSGPHLQGRIQDIFRTGFQSWDLMIAHPPCTRLTVAGARWFKGREKEQQEAIDFVRYLWNVPIEKVMIENPIGVLSTRWRKPDQIIQPWMFGHGETKATCLWKRGLPDLIPTDMVEGRVPRVHFASPGPERWKNRSRTYAGIADAFAEQWGDEKILQKSA
jgi:site-specific DNA-cytosine methylase